MSLPTPIDDSTYNETLEEPFDFSPFIHSFLSLPKWCFGFLASLFSTAETVYELPPSMESPLLEPQISEGAQPEPLESSEEQSFMGAMIKTLFTHFPAKLIVGPVDQDMSVVSMVLLSAFVASLTTLFIVYLYGILWFLPRKPFDELSASTQTLRKSGKPQNLESSKKTASKSTFDPSERGADSENANIEQDLGDGKSDNSAGGLTLHQFPRGGFIPCAEVEGFKIETLLRLAKIPFEVRFDCDNTGPWLERGSRIIWGSRSIISFLEVHYPRHMERLLVSEECAIQAHLISLHVESEVCWLLYHWRWFYGISNKDERFAWSKIPTEYVELAASSWNRKFGNVPIDCILTYLDKAFQVLEHVLGDGDYFVGDRLSVVDVSAFAVLSQALWGMPTTAVQGLLLGKDNLVRFCQRMRNRCWTDWEEHLLSAEISSSQTSSAGAARDFTDDITNEQHAAQNRSRTRPLSKSNVPFYHAPDVGAPNVTNVPSDTTTVQSHSSFSSFEDFSEKNKMAKRGGSAVKETLGLEYLNLKEGAHVPTMRSDRGDCYKQDVPAVVTSSSSSCCSELEVAWIDACPCKGRCKCAARKAQEPFESMHERESVLGSYGKNGGFHY